MLSSTPQHYKDGYFVALGASYRMVDGLTLRAGTAFDRSPVSNTYRTARVPDQDRFWLALGASYQVLSNATLDVGYAHISVKNSSINEVSPTGDVLSGHYTNAIDIVSVGMRLQF